MGDLITLDFRGSKVRQVGTIDRPEWVLKDVCDVLGIANPSMFAQEMPENEKGLSKVYTLGANGRGQYQDMLVVTEPGVYRLVTRSNKDAAKEFQSWLFNEVLPALRKHGCYPPPESAIVPLDLGANLAKYIERLDIVIDRFASSHQLLQNEISTVKTEVSGVKSELSDLKLTVMSLAGSGRKSFPVKVYDTHRAFIIDGVYGGACPCCGERKIFEGLKFTGQKEHAVGVGNVTLEHTWLVCQECNQGQLKYRRSGAEQAAFQVYQNRLAKWLQNKKAAQLTLFGSR